MILKSACTHCSTHIEFESEHVGTVVSCPVCNKPTKLSMLSPARGQATNGQAMGAATSTLDSVRANTCYRTLRTLITVTQITFLVMSALTVLAGILHSVVIFGFVRNMSGTSGLQFVALLPLFAWLIAAVLFALAGIATKHFLHMVVDIADCQLQQIARGK